MDNDEVALCLSTTRDVVSMWRKRFFEEGLQGRTLSDLLVGAIPKALEHNISLLAMLTSGNGPSRADAAPALAEHDARERELGELRDALHEAVGSQGPRRSRRLKPHA